MESWLERRHNDPEFRRELEVERLLLAMTEELVEIIERAGLSRREAANAAGIAESALSRALRGGHNLTLRSACLIAFAGDARLRVSSESIAPSESDWTVGRIDAAHVGRRAGYSEVSVSIDSESGAPTSIGDALAA